MMNEKKNCQTYRKNKSPGTKSQVLSVALALLAACLTAAGCSLLPGKNVHENLQEDNNVAGFLFHFDQREETQRLVKFKNKNELPVSVTWFYPDEETKKILKAAVESVSEAATEEGSSLGVITSTDPDKIIDIYNALNNVIIVGSGNNVITEVQYYITFTLPDDSTCTYEFISENTIRLSDHNYTIETDGNLWKTLRQ